MRTACSERAYEIPIALEDAIEEIVRRGLIDFERLVKSAGFTTASRFYKFDAKKRNSKHKLLGR